MATYVDRVLEPGERVRYRTTVSWIVYIPSVVLAAIALAALLVGIDYPDRDRFSWFVATISAMVAMCVKVGADFIWHVAVTFDMQMRGWIQ
jgi:hypothetical protein